MHTVIAIIICKTSLSIFFKMLEKKKKNDLSYYRIFKMKNSKDRLLRSFEEKCSWKLT